MHVAALSENGPEVRCRFPGMLQKELELFSGGAIVRRECVPPVVILDQQGQQAQQFSFFRGACPPMGAVDVRILGQGVRTALSHSPVVALVIRTDDAQTSHPHRKP
jgi:hypothetical protein